MNQPKTSWRSRWFLLPGGLAAIAMIAVADLYLDTAIPLSLLYLLPISLMSTVLRRWQVILLGALVTVVAEYSDAFAWNVQQGIPRDALYFAGYTAAGLYVYGILRARSTERTHRESLQTEMEAREAVEEQLRLLVANSSLAIFIADETGLILQANAAAEHLFADEDNGNAVHLQGSTLNEFLPSLAKVQIRRQGWDHLKTMMQCQALRSNREPFLADVWFSTYMTSDGGRLTVMMMDASVEIRDREEASLEQTLAASKLAVSALSHEIRNVSAAISVVTAQLSKLSNDPDSMKELEALRQLVTALERLCSQEVIHSKSRTSVLRPQGFMKDLYIILHASLRDAGVALDWTVEDELPEVWADSQSLLQVCLNIARNTQAAVADVVSPILQVAVSRTTEGIQIRFTDNGPGPTQPDELFRPFSSGTGASGLGLYLSRAMMRGMRGELRYDKRASGATFLIDLVAVEKGIS